MFAVAWRLFLNVWFGVVLMIGLMISDIKPASAQTKSIEYKQALAQAAATDKDIAAFYKAYEYNSIWTGRSNKERSRRKAFLSDALQNVDEHGLPSARYNGDGLLAQFKAARKPQDLAKIEVAISRAFLQYAQDIQTGVLVPKRVDSEIARSAPYRERISYLTGLVKSSPKGYFNILPPPI